MNPNTFRKQPWEERTLKFDVTKALADGDVLSSIDSVKCFLGATEATGMVTTTSATGNYVYAHLTGGVDNNDYVLRVRVLTDDGDKLEDELSVIIRD